MANKKDEEIGRKAKHIYEKNDDRLSARRHHSRDSLRSSSSNTSPRSNSSKNSLKSNGSSESSRSKKSTSHSSKPQSSKGSSRAISSSNSSNRNFSQKPSKSRSSNKEKGLLKSKTRSHQSNSEGKEVNKSECSTSKIRKMSSKPDNESISSTSKDTSSTSYCSDNDQLPDTNKDISDTEDEHSAGLSLAESIRPIRAAAATAQAISEAQQAYMDIEPPPEFKRNSKGQIEILSDKPMKPRKYTRRAKVADNVEPIQNDDVGKNKQIAVEAAPQKEMQCPPKEDTKDPMTFNTSHVANNSEEKVPPIISSEKVPLPSPEHTIDESANNSVLDFEDTPQNLNLSMLLESVKNQYIEMIELMQKPEFGKNIESQIKQEKGRKKQLSKRISQLEYQIDTLIQDSLGMLKSGLKSLGIEATSPPEFIERAKGIVCEHNDLLKQRYSLEEEIKNLVDEQNVMMKNKESELVNQLLKQTLSDKGNLSELELVKIVERKIQECLEPQSNNPTAKNSKGFTLTKVNVNQSNSNRSQSSSNLSAMDSKDHDLDVSPTNDGCQPSSNSVVSMEVDVTASPELTLNERTEVKSGQVTNDETLSQPIDYNRNELNMSPSDIEKNVGLDMRQRDTKDVIPNKVADTVKENQPSWHNGSCSKVVDHINKEIERNMRAELLPAPMNMRQVASTLQHITPKVLDFKMLNTDGSVKMSSLSTDQFISLSVEQALEGIGQSGSSHSSQRYIGNMPPNVIGSRLSRVIEDSVRGVPEISGGQQMEGLACPRSLSSPKCPPKPIDMDPRVNFQGRLASHSAVSYLTESLPGRASDLFEKEITGRRGDTPDTHSSSRPTSRGSKCSLHTPDPTMNLEMEDRKRAGSPMSQQSLVQESPVKKQHSNKEGIPILGQVMTKDKCDDARKWQDEISSGFDRLVALASEVDKRRRSSSDNSSPRNSATLDNAPSRQVSEENSEIQDLSTEKCPQNEQMQEPPYALRNQEVELIFQSKQSNFTPEKELISDQPYNVNPSVLPSCNPSSTPYAPCPITRPSGPGEKLADRHFKKKYFDQEYQKLKQQSATSIVTGRPGPDNQSSSNASQSNYNSQLGQFQCYPENQPAFDNFFGNPNHPDISNNTAMYSQTGKHYGPHKELYHEMQLRNPDVYKHLYTKASQDNYSPSQEQLQPTRHTPAVQGSHPHHVGGHPGRYQHYPDNQGRQVAGGGYPQYYQHHRGPQLEQGLMRTSK